MKCLLHALFLLPAILTGLTSEAQFHAPFHADSRKAYMDLSGLGRVYSLAFDSATAEGSDSLFHHFGRLNDTSTFMSAWCPGWGNPYCLPTDLPEWSGGLFRHDGTGTYLLRNLAGDTLRLELDLAAGDTSVFFQQDDQRFAIVREDHDTLTVLGVQDSVITYRILHTDTLGTPIPSALHQQPLRVGKVLGLTHFFQVDSFPQVLRPLEMIGNKGPDAGLHRITSGMVYDHQPGDVIQRYTANSNPGGPPWNTYSTYSKATFLTRSDSPTSIFYSILSEEFDPSDGSSSSSTVTQVYPSQLVLFEIPFERFVDASNVVLVRSMRCGVALFQLVAHSVPYIQWCPEDRCWSYYDTNGPEPSESWYWTLGLGDPESTATLWVPPPQGYTNSSTIVYFEKEGIPCGSEQFLGVQDAERAAVRAYPNPTPGLVRLEGMDPRSIIRVYDATGRPIPEQIAGEGTIDLSDRAEGLYFVEGNTTSGGPFRVCVVVVH